MATYLHNYLHTFRAADGSWSGLVLRPVATIEKCAYPVEVMSKARAQDSRVLDLPRDCLGRLDHTVAVEVPNRLADWLESRGLTAAQVLASFANDLAETDASNGSDERRLANEWFERVVWPEQDEGEDEGEDAPDDRDLSPLVRAGMAAMEWRESSQASDFARVAGLVLVYDGKAYGWKDQLRNPEDERPGAMAVDVLLGVWIAEGGNDQDGAERWVPFHG